MNMATALLRGLSSRGLGGAITGVHHSEDALASALIDLSERHATDHEIHVVARDLAAWSREHVRRLAEAGEGYGVHLAEPTGQGPAWQGALKKAAGEVLGRLQAPSALLLADLREIHVAAAGTSLDWEILAQAAQAAEDSDLLELAADCHPQTLRQLRWANAQVKELAAQAVLAT